MWINTHTFTTYFSGLFAHLSSLVQALAQDFTGFNPCFYFESIIRNPPPLLYYNCPGCSRFIPLQQQQHQRDQVTGLRSPPPAMHQLLFVLLAALGAALLGLPGVDASPAVGPCVAPLQWEGRWVLYDHSTGRNHRAAVSYDALNQRIRVLQQHKKHTPCQK